MTSPNQEGIHQLYQKDPLEADWRVFGRKSNPQTRRGFLKGLSTMTALLGAEIVFANHMPAGLIPAALSNQEQPFTIEGKDSRLLVLNDRPINAETPAHLLDDAVTPSELFFVRNNGIPPKKVNASTWRLEISGEAVGRPQSFSIEDLKTKFEPISLQLTLECGGNGRHEFYPSASGNQWQVGAVGCPLWTGVRLRDVLQTCQVKHNAVYIGYYGADTHLSGRPDKIPISRGVPMEKALAAESMVAWGMNGKPLPIQNGFPLRLVFGGWPASTSGKWLKKIVVRNKVHDGAKMGGSSYRVPCFPVAPGQKVADRDMCIIESMPVKSLITFPKSGRVISLQKPLKIRGHAWAGEQQVQRVDVSMDFGQTWKKAVLSKPVNKHAWQHFEAQLQFPKSGYYEIWAKATDASGKSQPMLVPGWNPKGYLNNACHRIAIRVKA